MSRPTTTSSMQHPLLFLLLAAAVTVAMAGETVTITAGGEISGGVEYYDGLFPREDEPYLSVRSLDISPQQLSNADFVTFPNGEEYTVPTVYTDDQFITYEFMGVGSDAEGFLTVDLEDGTVSGSVEGSDGTVFEVDEMPEELGGGEDTGKHVWAEVNPRLPMEKETGPDTVRSGKKPEDTEDMDTEPGFVHIVSIKVYFTREYEQRTKNVREKIEGMIAKTNAGFADSGCEVRLDLICIEEYRGEEVWDAGTMLEEFGEYKGSRDALLGSADLAVLVCYDISSGGIANIGNTDKPFAVVPKMMGEDYNSFGHELGHVFGANHDWQMLKGLGFVEPPVPHYSMGRLIPNTKKYTIMSYPNYGMGYTESVNFYSGPNTKDNDGEITGTVRYNDVVRVINEHGKEYSQIGDESQRCPTFDPIEI